MPRPYTEDEVRDMLIDHIRATARYWASLPEKDKATGREITVLDRCEGVAFSILSTLDGCSLSLPPVTLKLDPHPEDKGFLSENGENWFEPGMEISTMLHEFFHQRPKPNPPE